MCTTLKEKPELFFMLGQATIREDHSERKLKVFVVDEQHWSLGWWTTFCNGAFANVQNVLKMDENLEQNVKKRSSKAQKTTSIFQIIHYA